MPIEEKIKHADYVIDNSGSLEKVEREVEKVHSALVKLAVEKGKA